MGKPTTPLSPRILGLVDRGFSALQEGDHARAAASAAAILSEDPQQVDALYLSGLIAKAREDFVAAEDAFERAILAKEDFADPYVALLELLLRLDRKEDFEQVYALARARVPSRPEPLSQLAGLLVAQQPERALAEYECVLAQEPDRLEAIAGRYRALVVLGRAAEAAADARVRWSREPSADHAVLLGITLVESGAFEEAESVMAEGRRKDPSRYAFHYDLCLALHRSGAAEERFRPRMEEFLERFPGDAQGEFLQAFRSLARGRFAEGFTSYEARKRLPGAHVTQSAPIPEWDGGPLAGRRLLVLDEQGYGDNLMFARFLPRLLERDISFTYACPDALYALIAAQPELIRARVVRRGRVPPWEEGDVFLPIMSLPYRLGIPDPVAGLTFPYLEPLPELSVEWAHRIPAEPLLRVGIAWAANPRQSVGRERSVPWDMLAPLLDTPGTRFYSLQVGPGRLDGSLPRIEDLAPSLYDFADTAAAVSHLDLVISADTSVAHVAGALGKPLWVMTPFLTDWRFETDESGKPYWYPHARVFRQSAPGAWDSVLKQAQAALREAAQARARA